MRFNIDACDHVYELLAEEHIKVSYMKDLNFKSKIGLVLNDVNSHSLSDPINVHHCPICGEEIKITESEE